MLLWVYRTSFTGSPDLEPWGSFGAWFNFASDFLPYNNFRESWNLPDMYLNQVITENR